MVVVLVVVTHRSFTIMRYSMDDKRKRAV